MKKKILLSLLALALCIPAVALLSGASVLEPPKGETRKEIASKLYGRIKFVDAAPDYRVRIVKAAPDLRVRIVDAAPNQIGEWQIVDAAEDYRVQLVKAAEDLCVMLVDYAPGIN